MGDEWLQCYPGLVYSRTGRMVVVALLYPEPIVVDSRLKGVDYWPFFDLIVSVVWLVFVKKKERRKKQIALDIFQTEKGAVYKLFRTATFVWRQEKLYVNAVVLSTTFIYVEPGG